MFIEPPNKSYHNLIFMGVITITASHCFLFVRFYLWGVSLISLWGILNWISLFSCILILVGLKGANKHPTPRWIIIPFWTHFLSSCFLGVLIVMWSPGRLILNIITAIIYFFWILLPLQNSELIRFKSKRRKVN